jgi:hypothetical protein
MSLPYDERYQVRDPDIERALRTLAAQLDELRRSLLDRAKGYEQEV